MWMKDFLISLSFAINPNMKILKSQAFISYMPQRELAVFVNKNNIKREDILIITQENMRYTLFFYSEE